MANDPVEEQIAAYNAHDLERFLACYAPEVIFEDASNVRLLEGRQALQEAYASLFANSPELHAEVPTRIRAGEFVVDEEWVTGVQGKPEPIHAVVVYRVRDGRIVHVRMLR